MTFRIVHQERYSRGELILRTLFGWLYIAIPHGFLLFFLGLWSAILAFIAFWVVLFTARYPQSMFEYQIKLNRWSMRLQGSLWNLFDGYPAFGLDSADEKVVLDAPRPERVSRGLVILRLLLGWAYVVIPHFICLIGRGVATGVLNFLAWWAILFAGRYPERWHAFNVGTLRWLLRIDLYLGYLTDEYPPFSGKERAPAEVTG